jgi:hypothetical protein
MEPNALMDRLMNCLRDLGVGMDREPNSWIVRVDVTPHEFWARVKARGISEDVLDKQSDGSEDEDGDGDVAMQGVSVQPTQDVHVSFELEICRIPRMNLYGLHFKRLKGGVWSYKRICSAFLSILNL